MKLFGTMKHTNYLPKTRLILIFRTFLGHVEPQVLLQHFFKTSAVKQHKEGEDTEFVPHTDSGEENTHFRVSTFNFKAHTPTHTLLNALANPTTNNLNLIYVTHPN